MTSMRQVLKKLKKKIRCFVYYWFLLKSYYPDYPDIDISHWLREDVHWMMDKVF